MYVCIFVCVYTCTYVYVNSVAILIYGLSASGPPSMLRFLIVELELRSPPCALASCVALPMKGIRERLQGWRRKERLVLFCLLPVCLSFLWESLLPFHTLVGVAVSTAAAELSQLLCQWRQNQSLAGTLAQPFCVVSVSAPRSPFFKFLSFCHCYLVSCTSAPGCFL